VPAPLATSGGRDRLSGDVGVPHQRLGRAVFAVQMGESLRGGERDLDHLAQGDGVAAASRHRPKFPITVYLSTEPPTSACPVYGLRGTPASHSCSIHREKAAKRRQNVKTVGDTDVLR
jgi:hypothetical protein